MASNSNDIAIDLSPLIKVYKDGRVERLIGSPYVPPYYKIQLQILQRHQNFTRNLCQALPNKRMKLPILLYFHGGGFCVESAFSFLHHRYINLLVSKANALAISVEYRLAPEHPLPAAYEDSWAALQWVASHMEDNSSNNTNMYYKEPWPINHGNFDKVYLGGDSSTGANIVHNMVIRASSESLLYGNIKIFGAFLYQPFFLGSNSMTSDHQNFDYKERTWMFSYPSAPGGIDNPMVNPLADDAPCLSGLGCSRIFVCVQ